MGCVNRALVLALARAHSSASTADKFRDGIFDLTKEPQEERTRSKTNKLSVTLLGVVTAIALKLKDLSFVLSFGGATLGNAIIFVFPAMMFRAAVKNSGREDLNNEVKLSTAVAAAGVAMGMVGAKMALATL